MVRLTDRPRTQERIADQAEPLRALARQIHLRRDRRAPSFGAADARGPRVIAVSSGKGGVGKTNVAVNLAIALGQLGKRVVVFDADLGLANVDVVLGIKPRHTLEHVIAGERRLEEIVVAGPPNVRVVPGASGLRDLANLPGYRRQELIRGLERVGATADFMLVDTAAGVGAEVSEFVRAAHEVLVVTTPDPTAITDAYALVKILVTDPTRLTMGPAEGGDAPRLHLIVNQAAGYAEAAEVTAKITGVARRFLGVEIDSFGYLPADPALSQAVRRQVPILLAYPQSAFAKRLYALGRQIAGQPAPEPRANGLASFLRQFAGAGARA